MSIKVMSWVWDNSSSGGTDRLILLAIADHAGDDGGQAWPSIARLATKANVSERTVQRCIQNLIEAGELEVEFGTGHRSSRYTVLMREGCQSVTPAATGEAPGGDDPAPLGRQADTPGVTDRHPRHDTGGTLTTNNHQEPIKEPKSGPAEPDAGRTAKADDDPSPVVVELCNLLADKIEANGSKRPKVGKAWFAACRLMIDQDKREPGKIRTAIEWCQADEFWRANILSMPKLREKYDQLRLAAQRPRPAAEPELSTSERLRRQRAASRRY